MKTGIDIVEISRIKKAAENSKFLKRCFTENEIKYFDSKPEQSRISSIAGNFAVKEAVSKALGTGLIYNGVGFKDIEVLHNNFGAPKIQLFGKAYEIFAGFGKEIEVSISHCENEATAICIIL